MSACVVGHINKFFRNVILKMDNKGLVVLIFILFIGALLITGIFNTN